MKKSVVVTPPDPKIRRAIANSSKAFKKYAQEQARKLNPVRSKTEEAQFTKLQAVIGKDLAFSARETDRVMSISRPTDDHAAAAGHLRQCPSTLVGAFQVITEL